MKGCLKFFLIGLFIFIGIAIVASLFRSPDNKIKTDTSDNVDAKPKESEPVTPSSEIPFDLANATSLPFLIGDLDSCYLVGSSLPSLDGPDLDVAIQTGNRLYNRAYKRYLEFQGETNGHLSRGKSKVINDALTIYSEIFNNTIAQESNSQAELDFIKDNLEGFPGKVTQIEKDYDGNVFRVILGPNAKKKVTLPEKGTWCVTTIQGGERILIEGAFQNNGYGKFDAYGAQLPIYLGTTKDFSIENPQTSPSLQITFQECKN